VWKKILKKKTECFFMFYEQNVGQNYNTNIATNVANFKYFGTTLTNKTACIEKLRADQIQRFPATVRFQNILCSGLLSKKYI
jgi:hypothetical protein